jgi:geranylgeranyl pyrophosphate synthase
VQAGWALAGGTPGELPERLPLVIELLHAGSLIVDDVEDGSPERRGGPALHELIGVPLAINTGSWMYFWALAELAALGLPADVELRAHRAATTTLVLGHQGQALDLAVRIADLDMAEVPAVVAATTRLKTATLCRLATELGALAAGASADRLDAIGRFGEAAGTGLQMLDDLGSLNGPARRAKGREDLRGGRPAWPWAWLAVHRPFAWARLAAMERAVAAGDEGSLEPLIDALAEEVSPFGRAAIRTTLAGAVTDLTRALGPSPALTGIAGELARMEQSYG